MWKRIGAMLSVGVPLPEEAPTADEAIAQADSQMKWARYDEAARMLVRASEREPLRIDVKVKLLQVYFISGQPERFLALARQLHADGRAASEWPLIVAMGKQVCPSESLFF
jgi:pilus assembly protein FimV